MPDNFEFPFPTDLYYKDKDGNYIPFNLEDFVTVIKPSEDEFAKVLQGFAEMMDTIEQNIEVIDEFKSPDYEISIECAAENYMVFVTIYPNTENEDTFCVYHSKNEDDARGAYALYVMMFNLGKVHTIKDCVTGIEAEVIFGTGEEDEDIF